GVLYHRPQQDIRAETGRPFGRLLDQLRRGELLITDKESAVLLPDGAASAVEVEQRQAVVLRVHLRVITARSQIRSGERSQLDGRPRDRKLAGKDLANKGVRRRGGRVVAEEAARAEDVFEPLAEGVGHARAWLVSATQAVDDRGAEFGCGKESFELVEGVVD